MSFGDDYFGKIFSKYDGMKIDDFEIEMRKYYPFCELSFDAGGGIDIITGEHIGNESISIPTGLYEGEFYGEDGVDLYSVVKYHGVVYKGESYSYKSEEEESD